MRNGVEVCQPTTWRRGRYPAQPRTWKQTLSLIISIFWQLYPWSRGVIGVVIDSWSFLWFPGQFFVWTQGILSENTGNLAKNFGLASSELVIVAEEAWVASLEMSGLYSRDLPDLVPRLWPSHASQLVLADPGEVDRGLDVAPLGWDVRDGASHGRHRSWRRGLEGTYKITFIPCNKLQVWSQINSLLSTFYIQGLLQSFLPATQRWSSFTTPFLFFFFLFWGDFLFLQWPCFSHNSPIQGGRSLIS